LQIFSDIKEIYIESLYLNNFRAHKDSLIEFSKKNNIILGENGSGKSSILIAIVFALFGADGLNVYEKSGRKTNLVKRGENLSKVELKLRLETEKGPYRVLIRRNLRSLDEKELSEIKVSNDGTNFRTYTTGIENVREFVFKKIFDVDERNLNIIDLIYCRQGELGEFIKKLPTMENARFIDKVLEINKITEIIDLLNSKLNELKNKHQSKSKTISEIETLVQDFEKELRSKNLDPNNKEELLKIIEKRNDIEGDIKDLTNSLIKAKEFEAKIDKGLLEEKSKLEKEYSDLQQKINELEEKIKSLKSEVKSIDSKKPYGEYKEPIEVNEQSFKEALSKYSQDVEESLRREISSKEYDLRTIEKIDPEKLKDLDDLKERLEELKSEKHSIIARIDDLRRLIDLLKKGKLDKCPLCGSDISNKYEQIKEEKEKELEKLNERLRSIEKRIDILNERIRSLEKDLATMMSISKKYDIDPRSVKEFLSNSLNDLKTKLDQLLLYKGIIVKYYERLLAEKEAQIDQLNEALKGLMSKKTELEIKIKKINETEELITEYNSLLECLKEKYSKDFNSSNDISNLIEELEKELKNLPELSEDYVNQYFNVLEKLEKNKKDKEDIENKIELASKLIKQFEKLRRTIREFFVSRITVLLNEWFRRIYNYSDIVSLEFVLQEPQRKTSEQLIYSIVIKFADGSTKDIREAGLSGGQLTALDIAFRFSLLNLVLPRVRFILFDEPTNSLDENVRLNLVQTLKEISDLQIIVATHDELFKEAADRIVKVQRRPAEGSMVELQ